MSSSSDLKVYLKEKREKFRGQFLNPSFSSEFREELRREQPDNEELTGQSRTRYVVDRSGERNEIAELRRVDEKSDFKVIVSGGVVELWEYQFGVKHGKRVKDEREDFTADDWGEERFQKEIVYDSETGEILNKLARDPLEARKNNARRARNEGRRLILANFNNGAKFVTLTFRDGSVNDVKNVRECNKVFELFIKRMRKRFGGFKYFKVIEFQDKYKRGAVHYHFLADLPYISVEKLAEIWGHGFVGINDISKVDNVGAYVTAYMLKDFADDRLFGEKAYSTSKGNNALIRPIVVFGAEAEAIIKEYLQNKKEVFTNSYESEYQGKIVYKEFNLARGV